MKHIHFIGICGVGMSALAILWKKKGWKVTGSDAGFYPPVSTHLEQNQINFYAGWHPEKMTIDGDPDLVVVGNVAGSENPEWQYVQTHNIEYVSYPELIARELVKKNSIVCAGTWGKTSTTALLAYVLKKSGLKPAYMFGGLSLGLPYAADDEGGDWSVLEGDEYKTGKDNPEAKFFSYRPTHLLLTGLSWDHFDMYPTEESYYEAFDKLLANMPENGIVVACENDQNIKRVIESAKCEIVKYGTGENYEYNYSDVLMNKNGIQLIIESNGIEYKISSPMLGEYMAENICAVFAMAREINIPENIIIQAIGEFGGIKRRLEKRGTTNIGADIFDDIAHSPTKAKSALGAIKKIYNGKIIAIFEPNTGNRQISSAPSYDRAFENADEVIVPRLTKIKINEQTKDSVMDENKLAEVIGQTHPNVKIIENDDELIEYLKQKTTAEDAVVFLGSHGFRGMIEKMVSK
jgi:UDP-N-acetylmuramate: L-alanyl-gamma-D-glutamyl-meso-diaminopimelate ligase